MSLPLATLSTLPPSSRASTTALPRLPVCLPSEPLSLRLRSSLTSLQGPSGIPEVPSSGLPSPPTSPPLAALTSSNELALLPKQKKREMPGRHLARRGGAALSIREECERFFCESMKMAFLGERNLSMNGSSLSGALLPTPPPDDQFPDTFCELDGAAHSKSRGFNVEAWMELWDYAGGASFRAFVVNNGAETSLFVFFDVQGVLGRDLKKAYEPFTPPSTLPCLALDM